MYYGDDLIEQVRAASDIEKVVGTYVNLTPKGSNLWGLCPFHSEKTGSFSVNRRMQIFKCFGCGKAGNVFTFIMDYENMTFPEAVRLLAERANIPLPEQDDTPEDKRRREIRERILEVNRETAKFYYFKLRSEEGRHAYEYLTGRALSDETIKKFGLGFAGKNANELYRYLKSKNFDDDVLSQTGLFSYSEKGVMDKFWNRVMFPIMDRNGKVIAFGGRIMGNAENTAKYLNSPETKVFLKGDNLFGLNISKHSKRNYMLLCEGYMDTIALHQAGFDNAIASLGTALTPKQARLISHYVSEVILTYDSDEAGRKAALRAIPILKAEGITARVLDMTPYKDPDEFIKALGKEEYEKRISSAKEAFFYEAESMHGKIDPQDPAEKTTFDHELAEKLARIEDEIERNNYIEASARKYNIDVNALKREVNKVGRKLYDEQIAADTMEREKRERKEMTTAQSGPVKSQEMLISMMANEPELYALAKGELTAEDFTDPFCGKLFMILEELYMTGDAIVHARIVNRFDEVADQERVAGILDDSSYKVNIDEQELKEAFADLLVRVLGDGLDARWQKAVAGNDGGTVMQLMTRKDEIAELRGRLLRR